MSEKEVLMNSNYSKLGLLLFSVRPSTVFADGGVSGALGAIDSMILIILIMSVLAHALVVYLKSRGTASKQMAPISLSVSAFTISFWLIQFLDNIANRLYYSWPNYHGGVLLPVILIILMVIIIWTIKATLQQSNSSDDSEK